MKKDYWDICARNYNGLAFITFIFAILVVLNKKFETVVYLLIGVVVWIVLGRMFVKKSPRAITASYIIVGLLLAINAAVHISDPAIFAPIDIIVYLIYLYLIGCSLKTQTQQSKSLPNK